MSFHEDETEKYSDNSFESDNEELPNDSRVYKNKSHRKWKKLSQFVLHEDQKVFRMALSNVNHKLYELLVNKRY